MVTEVIRVLHCQDAEHCTMPSEKKKNGTTYENIRVVHGMSNPNDHEQHWQEYEQKLIQTLDEIRKTDPKDKKAWGHKAWESLDAICTFIPCDTCSEHCHKMIHFEHDVVNKHLGKPLNDPEHYYSYIGMIAKQMEE